MRLTRTWNAGAFLRSTVAALAVIAAPAVAQAQQGTVSGRVTAATSNEPLGDVRVLVTGTTINAVTNQEGRYTLRLPAGNAEIHVLRVGYTDQKKPVVVTAGGASTVDFVMTAQVLQLQSIVTTATGETRRVELGNNIATLGDVNQKAETTPVTDLQDLLVAKVAGVTVLPADMTGAAPTIRIRGLSSVSLSNSPIYVIDGIRMNAGTLGLETGGTQASLLNDLDPNEIEDIEIVKGPSAATLYGTDAANGVIVITTKKGHAGTTRWTWYGEGGAVDDRNNYGPDGPGDFATWGKKATAGVANSPASITRCTLVTQVAGTCVADSITSYNVLTNPNTTPFHLGNHQAYGGNATGGSDQVRFFVSGDWQNELGPVTMPAFAKATLDTMGQPLRGNSENPEAFQSYNTRANLSASLSPKFDLSTNAGFSNTNQRLPQVDNNIFSYLYSALNNPGFNFNSPSGIIYSETGSIGEFKNGYGGFSPAQIFQVDNTNGTQRFIGSTDATWRPFDWMQNQATTGLDLANTEFVSICRFNECPNSGIERLGNAEQFHSDNRNFSAKLISTSTWQAKSNLGLKTTVGADYTNLESDNVDAFSQELPPGSTAVSAGAIPSASDQQQTVNKTLGLYVQEQATFRDRLFLTGSLRTDQNSSFGTNFQRVVYPGAQLSWIASDESFFPHPTWLDQFRLRAAWGSSGVQPNGTQSLQTFGTTKVALVNGQPGTSASQADNPALLAAAIGNPNLKPEKSTELETGFETNVLNNRVHFDFTYYDKKTHDAIVNEPIAASTGASQLTVIANLGSVENNGLESDLNATLIDRRALGWDVTIAASHNSNKVLTLGNGPNGKPNPTIVPGGGTRDSVGFPIRGWFLRPFTFNDANGDGVIAPSEVLIDTTQVYDGYSVPRDIVSITNGLDLFSRKLRITVLTDYKGGYNLYNQSGQFYCSNFSTCSSSNGILSQKGTLPSLFDQARNVANGSNAKNAKNVEGAATTPATTFGYIENGQFWRLREVSAALTLPNSVASRIRARDAQLVFSARNLHVWTHYSGTDPEANYSTTDTQTDFSTTAPRTYFLIRANLHY